VLASEVAKHRVAAHLQRGGDLFGRYRSQIQDRLLSDGDPAASGLGLVIFFFPLLQPLLGMSCQPAIRQQGLQDSRVARATRPGAAITPHTNFETPGDGDGRHVVVWPTKLDVAPRSLAEPAIRGSRVYAELPCTARRGTLESGRSGPIFG
jgi:hypothetical protein